MMEKIIKYKTFGRLKENTHREEKNTHANFVMLKTNHVLDWAKKRGLNTQFLENNSFICFKCCDENLYT